MEKLILLGSLSAVVALTLASSWLVSRWAYYAILGLVVVMLIAGDSHWLSGDAPHIAILIAGDIVLFGVLYYFVTVQWMLQRKVTQIATRDEFRQILTDQGRFAGLARFVYYLPLGLLVGMIVVAIIGAYLQ